MRIEANYIDPAIQKVRQDAHSKKSCVPILLLPVRIETRFVKVERTDETLIGSHLVGEIIERFSTIELQLLEITKPLDVLEQKKTIQHIQQNATDIKESISRLNETTKQQKDLLTNAHNNITKEVRNAVSKLNPTLNAELLKTSNQLEQSVKAINDSAPTKSATAKRFVDDMVSLENKLRIFSTGNMPYTTHRNKKKLYKLIEGRVEEARQFYKNSSLKIEEIVHIEENLVKKIEDLHKKIISHLFQIDASFRAIHKDNNWINFIDATSHLIKTKYLYYFQQFEKEGIPNLKKIQKSNLIDANDYLVQMLSLKRAFKKYSLTQRNSYREAKTLNKYLERKINKINDFEGKVIGDNYYQRKQIEKHSADIASLLQDFGENLKLVATNNKDRKAGLEKIGKFVFNTYSSIRSREKAREPNTKADSKGSNQTNTKLKDELWLRIYPDDIFVHTHEKNLTAEEIANAKRYWKTVWAVDSDKELTLGAWKAMAAEYGSRRAAWITKTLGDLKLPKNNVLFQQNPSKDIVQTIKLLSDVLIEVKDKEPEPQRNPSQVDLNKIQLKLVQVIDLYERLRSKPQLIFFLEKSVDLVQRIYSRLNILYPGFQQPQTSSEVTVNPEFNRLFINLSELQKTLRSIPSSRTDQFLDATLDPYEYPNSSLLTPKAETWTEAPHTKVLPHQFVAIAKNDEAFEVIKVGKTIPDEVQLGLDPSKFNFDEESKNPFQVDENGDMLMEEGLRWMANFEDAVENGMAMKISLSPEQAKRGFDQLYVLGISNSSSTIDSAKLEELIENHHYSGGGLEFLKLRTATNNTEDVKAGFSSDDMDSEMSYKIEMGNPLFDESNSVKPYMKPDGEQLANALGISTAYFHHIHNSDLLQIDNSKAMHKALWHSTLGVYMEDMWDQVFTYDNIKRTYEFFTSYISARGPLPSIRIGNQPYGILPVTSFKHITFSDTLDEQSLPQLSVKELEDSGNPMLQERLDFRYYVRLKKLLMEAHGIWSSLREQHVNHAGNIATLDDPQAGFMNMLGLDATSTELYFRYGVNINDRTSEHLTKGENAFDDDKEVEYSPQSILSRFFDILKEGFFSPSMDWSDEIEPSKDIDQHASKKNSRIREQVNQSRIFNYRYLDKYFMVTGEMVSEEQNDKLLPLVANSESQSYIDWLLDPSKSIYKDIFNRNNLETLPSQSILFLLLRQSMLLAYREAALDILQNDDFFSEPFRRLLGSKNSYMSNSYVHFRTKWSYLLRPISSLLKPHARYDDLFYFEKNSSLWDKNEIKAEIKRIEELPLYVFLKEKNNSSLSSYIHEKGYRESYHSSQAHEKIIDRVDEIKEAIARLGTVSTEDLSLLLSEHLDVSSYRLDAWISGFANKRLEESRNVQDTGIYLGAYAWVEDLRPVEGRKKTTSVPKELAGNNEPIYTDSDNEGFIHAPSINHAISAAVLRSGYLANNSNQINLTNRMAVNLSSARVRKAMHLMDGVRSGLDLPILLGYQFERGLHERYKEVELDKFIYPLRKKFPLSSPIHISNQDESIRQTNVVNGLDLLESITDTIDNKNEVIQTSLYDYLVQNNFQNCPTWVNQFVIKFGSKDLGKEGEEKRDKEKRALIREIDQMADAFDAIGDVAISESIYQIVNGNHVRAASLISALGNGTVPPEAQILQTPRTGRVVTHRVLLHLDNPSGTPPNWNFALTPRAKAEPQLNYWVAKQIGDPAQVKCLIKNRNTDEEFTVRLDELGLHAIDLLFLLSNNKDQGNADLIDLILNQLKARQIFGADDVLYAEYSKRKSDWSASDKSFYQIEWILMQSKSILHNTRPIGYTDMIVPQNEPDVNNPNQYDDLSFQDRIKEIIDDAEAFRDELQIFVNTYPTSVDNTFFDKGYGLLKHASNYGITNLFANVKRSYGPDEADIIGERLTKAIDLLNERITAGKKYQESTGIQADINQKTNDLISAAKAILGEDFPIIPSYQHPDIESVRTQLNLSGSQSLVRASKGSFPMDEWLRSIANVRPTMYALDMLQMAMNMQDIKPSILKPVQYPYHTGDYWLGMEFPADHRGDDDKLSLILMNPDAAISGTFQKGLIIDEWVEVIPNKEETTGISFQYNQPDSKPPQTMLLAVSPRPVTKSSKWEWDDLIHILNDTLELAKNRAVEPDHLEESIFAQVLPSVISEVVPPQLSSVFDSPDSNPLGADQAVLDYLVNLSKTESD